MPWSLTFGGRGRTCGGRSANFSLSAAFRTCSSGTCRLTRSRNSRRLRGTFSPETAGEQVSGASHTHTRARQAVCPPHPQPRSPPGRSESGTTFSDVPPRPLWHQIDPRLQPARPATRGSGPGCSAAPEPPGPAEPRASRLVQRRPAAVRTGPGRVAPGGSGPGSRKQGGEKTGAGSSAVCRRSQDASSPAAPYGPRLAAPPAPSAAAGCSSAARGSPTDGWGSGSSSGPGRARALELRAPRRGVLGEIPGPPRPLLLPTAALTPHNPSSRRD